jgi:hypothetical protein
MRVCIGLCLTCSWKAEGQGYQGSFQSGVDGFQSQGSESNELYPEDCQTVRTIQRERLGSNDFSRLLFAPMGDGVVATRVGTFVVIVMFDSRVHPGTRSSNCQPAEKGQDSEGVRGQYWTMSKT